MHILYFRKHMLPRNVTQCVHRVIRLSACPHLPPHSLIVLSKCTTVQNSLNTKQCTKHTKHIAHWYSVTENTLLKIFGQHCHYPNNRRGRASACNWVTKCGDTATCLETSNPPTPLFPSNQPLYSLSEKFCTIIIHFQKFMGTFVHLDFVF